MSVARKVFLETCGLRIYNWDSMTRKIIAVTFPKIAVSPLRHNDVMNAI